MSEDSKNYEIEVDIYNMEFWKKGFTHDNIEFIPYEDYKERYEKIKDEKIYYPTGKAKISLSAYACNEAINKAMSIFSNYERLLTFAQGHYVFSRYYECYEVENGNRHKNGGLLSSVVGVNTPPGVSIIRPAGIEEFIKTAIPLINNKEYVEKTGIDSAITWFIAGNPWHIETVFLTFPIKWMVLEMLANAHAKSKGKEFIISDDNEFLNVTAEIEKLIKNDLNLDRVTGKNLCSNLECIKRISIEHRIGSLLKKYKFKQYNSEIKELKNFRDSMIHGNVLSSYNFNELINFEKKIIRLLEKIMLSVLCFYDNEFVRPAIRKDRLLAV